MTQPRGILKNNAYKIITFALLLGCLFLILRMCGNQNRINELEGIIQNDTERLKKFKDSVIQANYSEIKSIKEENGKLLKNAQQSQLRYDSLELVKREIKIVHVQKLKEIESFNGEQIENYWKDEFK
jgi:hypothetical protein